MTNRRDFLKNAAATGGELLRQRRLHLLRQQQSRHQDRRPGPAAVNSVGQPVPVEAKVRHP